MYEPKSRRNEVLVVTFPEHVANRLLGAFAAVCTVCNEIYYGLRELKRIVIRLAGPEE